jgi:hypothetical protein
MYALKRSFLFSVTRGAAFNICLLLSFARLMRLRVEKVLLIWTTALN